MIWVKPPTSAPKFPSLIGRLTTRLVVGEPAGLEWFPSLIGRLTTTAAYLDILFEGEFPSLIGRLTTVFWNATTDERTGFHPS